MPRASQALTDGVAALEAAGIVYAGLSTPSAVHATGTPAIFVQCGDVLYRVDFESAEKVANEAGVVAALAAMGKGAEVVT